MSPVLIKLVIKYVSLHHQLNWQHILIPEARCCVEAVAADYMQGGMLLAKRGFAQSLVSASKDTIAIATYARTSFESFSLHSRTSMGNKDLLANCGMQYEHARLSHRLWLQYHSTLGCQSVNNSGYAVCFNA